MNRPKLWIMRGLPGSGKSRRARRIANREPDTVVCSADDYPGLYSMVDGKTRIDLAKQGAAHAWCARSVINALRDGFNVVVDNTSIPLDEVSPYVLIGQAHDAAHAPRPCAREPRPGRCASATRRRAPDPPRRGRS